jgi:hypothetical protein
MEREPESAKGRQPPAEVLDPRCSRGWLPRATSVVALDRRATLGGSLDRPDLGGWPKEPTAHRPESPLRIPLVGPRDDQSHARRAVVRSAAPRRPRARAHVDQLARAQQPAGVLERAPRQHLLERVAGAIRPRRSRGWLPRANSVVALKRRAILVIALGARRARNGCVPGTKKASCRSDRRKAMLNPMRIPR